MMLPRLKLPAGSNDQNTKGPSSRAASLLVSVLMVFVAVGCATQTRDAKDAPLVDGKYSLKKDREAFEELRKDIPEEIRRDNDEKAFMAELTADLTRSPQDVRNQFSKIINKKREVFGKDATRERDKFSQEIKKLREDFSKKQADERSDFAGGKKTSEERTRFYNRQDSDRREFNSEQQAKRDEFEEDMRDRRKNFDDYIRAKTDEFNQLHRDYTKRYEEDKKARSDVKKQAEEQRRQMQKNVDTEYEPIRKKDPTYLQAPPEGQ